MQRFVPRSRFIISRKDCTDRPHRTINSCFGAFHSARVHLGMFHYGSKLGAKRAEVVQLMQKFVPRSHIGIFRNKRARSTHWILNSCFRVFLSVWVHLGLCGCCMKLGAKWAKCGAIIAKVHATKSHRNFSLWTHEKHTMGCQTHVLLHFVLFGCIWERFVPALNSVQNGPNWCN